MIPRTTLKNRLRLAWAILRGRVYVDRYHDGQWGQTMTLRTRDDELVLR